jgi:hypothetical protein
VSASGPWAEFQAGPQQSGRLYPLHRGATRAKKAVGRVRLRARLIFLCLFFTEYSFADFVQMF